MRRNSHVEWWNRFKFYGDNNEALADPTNEGHDKEETMAFRERLESTVGSAHFTDYVRRSRYGIFSNTATIWERISSGSDSQTLWRSSDLLLQVGENQNFNKKEG